MAPWMTVCVLALYINGALALQDHYELLQSLLSKYDPEVRPICSLNDAITVKLGIALGQIINLDEPNQLITTNVWLRMRWNDCHLRWNASEYGGIDSIVISTKRIWIPDITLYDNAAEHGLFEIMKYNPTVYSDGSVYFNAPVILTSTCKIDVSYFPFDQQKCRLKFGSWAYHGFHIDITNRSESGDISNYKDNGEWNLVAIPVKRNVIYYGCCVEPYPDVSFFVIIRRRPLFYTYNLVFPCILITAIALLNFYLPPDSGEKVSLGVTVLLSLTVFLLLVSETMPPTSDTVPLIGQYFGATIALVSLSCAMTVFILNLHFKGSTGKTVPLWVRKLVLEYMAFLVCKKTAKDVPHKMLKVQPADIPSPKLKDSKTIWNLENNIKGDITIVNGSNGLFCPRLELLMQEQTEIMRKFADKLHNQTETDEIVSEWQMVALVVDRFLLILFTMTTIAVTLAILLQQPEYNTEASLE